MEAIRVATGTGRGPTELAAYDAALAGAGAHDYNLVRLSSVIPAGATVQRVDRLPELGAVGDRLSVVEASAVGDDDATAALAWGRRASESPDTAPGPGLFYEVAAADGDSPDAVRGDARTGLAAGADLRSWDLVERDVASASARSGGDACVAAVVVAAYGSGESLL